VKYPPQLDGVRCPHCSIRVHPEDIERHIEQFHTPSPWQALRQLITRRFLVYALAIVVLLIGAFFAMLAAISRISAALGAH
jgi:hypothetical protein